MKGLKGMDAFLRWIRRDYPPPEPSQEARQARERAERELLRLEAVQVHLDVVDRRNRPEEPHGPGPHRQSA